MAIDRQKSARSLNSQHSNAAVALDVKARSSAAPAGTFSRSRFSKFSAGIPTASSPSSSPCAPQFPGKFYFATMDNTMPTSIPPKTGSNWVRIGFESGPNCRKSGPNRDQMASKSAWKISARRPSIVRHASGDIIGNRQARFALRRESQFQRRPHLKFLPTAVLLFFVSGSLATAAGHHLAASPETVVVGNYWSESKPVLTVKSGDTVTIETVGTAGVAALERLNVPADQIPASLRAITAAIAAGTLPRGPGGHILTGPVFIEGAEPGDVLEVHIGPIEMPVPWAYNGFGPGSGFLPEDFNQRYGRLIPLDREHMLARFAPGISVPLHPFFGSMGVAPPAAAGKINSAPPGIHAGNLDNRNLVAGTTLYIPVHVTGALFQAGDGHAAQGDGEVDITGMETPLLGAFRFVVRKDLHLTWPRAETPTHFIVMGTDEDLTLAAKIAVREMIDFLVTYRGLSREDAYSLSSIAANFSITQLVDGKKGVHGMIAKSIFEQAPR